MLKHIKLPIKKRVTKIPFKKRITEICSKQIEECSICLEKIESTKKSLKCKHHFHEKCIDKWIKNNSSCPLCREKIKNPKDENNKNEEILNTIFMMRNYSPSDEFTDEEIEREEYAVDDDDFDEENREFTYLESSREYNNFIMSCGERYSGLLMEEYFSDDDY